MKKIALIVSALFASVAFADVPENVILDKNMYQPDIPTYGGTVGLGPKPPVADLPVGSASSIETSLRVQGEISDPLPNVKIPPLKFAGASLDEVLRLVTVFSDMSYSIIPGKNGVNPTVSSGARSDISMVGLGGNLPDVMDEISQAMGVHYVYKKGVLRVYPDRTFLYKLPTSNTSNLISTVTNQLNNLGAFDVVANGESGTVSFRANKPVYDEVSRYLSDLMKEPQIVYEISIIEVRLTDSTQFGIDWQNFGWKSGNNGINISTAGASLSSGMQIGLTYATGKLNLAGLFKFLGTQGSVKVLNQPILPVMSGQKSKMTVGETVKYVSSIGTTSVSQGTSSTTVTTEQLKTGTELSVAGAVRDQTVYTDIALKISDLVEMNSVSAGGTTIQLPRTADRDVAIPSLRVRPGEYMLIGGLILSKEEGKNEGPSIPGVGKLFTSYNNDNKIRSEMLMIVKPTVINFKHTGEQQ